ncbi:MAG TPA: hypothetical protein PLR64_04055 [Candidatus Dojkabacteria bacterium]|nr:hypothetical protein [Candidatus Dojkabacteria bacterium]
MTQTNTNEEVVDYLIKYINTYKDQLGYKEYSTGTLVDDMIYGIGVALSKEYEWANGYEKFRKDLVEYFSERYSK